MEVKDPPVIRLLRAFLRTCQANLRVREGVHSDVIAQTKTLLEDHDAGRGIGHIEKHYMLRAVPEHRRKFVEECGFVELSDATGAYEFWVLDIPKGPLKDMRNDYTEHYLLNRGVAYEIFVASKWGAGQD